MRIFPFDRLRPADDMLRRLHDEHRVSPLDPSTLRQADVSRALDQFVIQSDAGDSDYPFTIREVGRSFEGRAISLASIGKGPKNVLMWTQMHGDESTHTAVVLDLLGALVGSNGTALTGCGLLKECTLHLLPMLNPDGAERQTRGTAQGIDLNRDAVDFVAPESKILREVVLEVQPDFGFNLHNQKAGTPVADTGRVAAVSVLAPPVDKPLTETPGVVRAKKIAIEMFAAAERLLPGHATKYDADYMFNAFGEWVQTQGVATVLLEAGGWPGESFEPIVEHHFVVLASALRAIAEESFEQVDTTRYEKLPLNGKRQDKKTTS